MVTGGGGREVKRIGRGGRVWEKDPSVRTGSWEGVDMWGSKPPADTTGIQLNTTNEKGRRKIRSFLRGKSRRVQYPVVRRIYIRKKKNLIRHKSHPVGKPPKGRYETKISVQKRSHPAKRIRTRKTAQRSLWGSQKSTPEKEGPELASPALKPPEEENIVQEVGVYYGVKSSIMGPRWSRKIIKEEHPGAMEVHLTRGGFHTEKHSPEDSEVQKKSGGRI